MTLKQAILEEISEHYIFNRKFGMVHINESLVEAIENKGEGLLGEFNLATFNQEEGLPIVEIVSEKMDNLIAYSYID